MDETVFFVSRARAGDTLRDTKRVCAVCGGEIYTTEEWVYKSGVSNNMRWFCSWHCKRAYDREHPEPEYGKKRGRRRKSWGF